MISTQLTFQSAAVGWTHSRECGCVKGMQMLSNRFGMSKAAIMYIYRNAVAQFVIFVRSNWVWSAKVGHFC